MPYEWRINRKSFGFQRKIICPDYNSVCTSKIWCNDPLDCIDKEVKADESSYQYTYPLPSNFDLNSSFMINLNIIIQQIARMEKLA